MTSFGTFAYSYFGGSAPLAFIGELNGSSASFEAGDTKNAVTAKLTNNSIVILYNDLGDSGALKVVVARNLDTTPTFTSPVTVDSGGDNDVISMDALTSTTCIVCYRDGSDSDQGNANVISSLDGTPSVGSQFTFNSGADTNYSVTALSSTTAVVFYRDASDLDGKFRVLSDLAGTPAASGETTFRTGSVSTGRALQSTKLTSAIAVVCWEEVSNSGRFVVVSSLDGSPSVSSEVVYSSTSTANAGIVSLTSTTGVICFQDSGDADMEMVYISDLQGTPTSGSLTTVRVGTVAQMQVDKLTDTSALFVCRDGSEARAIAVTSLNSTPVVGTDFLVNNNVGSPPNLIDVTVTSSRNATVTFADDDASGAGTIQRVQ